MNNEPGVAWTRTYCFGNFATSTNIWNFVLIFQRGATKNVQVVHSGDDKTTKPLSL